MKWVLVIAGVVLAGAIYYHFFSTFGLGGGGNVQYAPDNVKTGEPAVVQLFLNAWGSGGPIGERYTDISLHYRLLGEQTYQVAQPVAVDLPDNYKKVATPTNQFEEYDFTIPPYPKGTSGTIEYYVDMTFDGTPGHEPGINNITLIK